VGVFSMPKHTIITFEVYVGIGCGVGWVTSYRDSRLSRLDQRTLPSMENQ